MVNSLNIIEQFLPQGSFVKKLTIRSIQNFDFHQ